MSCLGLFSGYSCHMSACYYRITVVLLSCDCRATIVSLSCYCRVTVVPLSCDCRATVLRLIKNALETCQAPCMNPTKSPAESRSNSYISVIYCQYIRRRSIHGLTHQSRAFHWFLYCLRALVVVRQGAFQQGHHNRSD